MYLDLVSMKTSELIRVYYEIISKEEKYKNVPIKFYKETYGRGSEKDRQKFRKEMIAKITAHRRLKFAKMKEAPKDEISPKPKKITKPGE